MRSPPLAFHQHAARGVCRSWKGTGEVCAKGLDLERPAFLPAQSRMARAALEWSLEDAAAAAGVSRRTVLRFERHHRDVRPELIEGLRRAYEAAGVWFVDEGPHAGSVTPPPLRVPTPR